MPFASGPVLTYMGLGRYRTVGPTVYVGATEVITIPSDTVTDLATVPRLFWALLPPHGAYERAAVLHDFGCQQLADGTCQLSSRDVDGLFRRVCRESGVGPITRWLLWCGVRYGALMNANRRPGIARDIPLITAISAAVLATAYVGVRALDRLVHLIF